MRNIHDAGAPSPGLSLPLVPDLGTRRLLAILPSAVLALLLAGLSVAVLARAPRPAIDWVMLAPFALVMMWECFIVWQLVLGFGVWLRGAEGLTPLERHAAALEPVATGRSRTALLMPIYEEDPDAVYGRVRIMLRSLARLGPCDDVDLHILSDTRDAATAAAERRLWDALDAEAPGRTSYRRRSANTGRKAGNIAEFLERRGPDYDFAVVLDADSLMSGAAIRRLIRLMEEHPRIGLIQTVSYATGRDTLFARIQQFAVRLYAPLSLRGLEFWQGPEGSYWGHNAIVRVAPFHQHCRLPVLPGRPPFGGEILCHDVVEAALLARAGWETHLLPEFEGTWEEMPTNAIDLLAREQRWCQGNLQHIGVLSLPGLKAASRTHLALGIGGYLIAPLWCGLLALGALRVLAMPAGEGYGILAYGLTEPGLAGTGLATLSASLILLPRLLNLARALGDGGVRRGFGGPLRLLCGAALEQALWLLLGPMLLWVTAGFVARAFAGRTVGWASQSRDERHVTVLDAVRRHALQVSLGCAFGIAAIRGGGWLAVWLAPTALGLVVSPLLTALTSRRDLGRLSRRLGLFLTVDDVAPAPEILEFQAAGAARFRDGRGPGGVLPGAAAAQPGNPVHPTQNAP